jgi:hypothetical protein
MSASEEGLLVSYLYVHAYIFCAYNVKKKKHFASKGNVWQRARVETSNFHPSPWCNWMEA